MVLKSGDECRDDPWSLFRVDFPESPCDIDSIIVAGMKHRTGRATSQRTILCKPGVSFFFISNPDELPGWTSSG